VSTTQPGDTPDEPEEPGKGERGASNNPGPSSSDSPLDDLFIVGAKYHEPSAAEREAAAKAAERANKKAMKAHEKEIARTRKVLGGDSDKGGRHRRHRRDRGDFSASNVERRTALLGLLAIVVLSVALSFTAFGH
jgi:hypothetical protein